MADKEVLKIATFFKKELSKYKIKYEWPKARDISKTYHYRWFKRFLTNCKEKHELNFEESKLLLKSIIKHAHNNGVLRSGATLLQRSDQIDIFIEHINNDIDKASQIIDDIKRCESRFVDGKYSFLKKRAKRGGYPNLVKMYMDGTLPASYMCLSKTCMKVYNELEVDDKNVMPNMLHLFKLRNKLIKQIGANKLGDILKKDFNGKIK